MKTSPSRSKSDWGIRFAIALTLIVGVVVGCTSAAVQSLRVKPEGAPADSPAQKGKDERQGIAYFLPKGMVRIVATRQQVVVTNSITTRATNEFVTNSILATVSSTNLAPVLPSLSWVTNQTWTTNVSSSNTVIYNTTGIFKVNTNTGWSQPGPTGSTNTVTNTLIVAYPQTQQVYKTNFTYEIAIAEEYEADPNALYLLQPNFGWNSDDDVRFTVSPAGLISSINTSNTDRSGEIVVELAKAAIEIYKLSVGGVPTASMMFVAENPVPNPPAKIDVRFNPFEKDSRDKAYEALKKGGLTLDRTPFEPAPVYKNWTNPPSEHTGVYYRPALPYNVKITSDLDESTITKMVLLPNQSPILYVDLLKSSFVTHVSQVTFTNGLLADFRVSKPSQGLALAKIPISILQSVASLPTNLIQFKFDISSARTRLISQQTNEVGALIALIDAQRRLDAAQKANATNTPTAKP